MSYTEQQVADARRLLAEVRDAEQRRENERYAVHVGRFYEYRNSYGSGEKWSLYIAVVGQDEHGWLYGVTFQETTSGSIEIESRGMLHGLVAEAKEITEYEYDNARDAILDRVQTVLFPAR